MSEIRRDIPPTDHRPNTYPCSDVTAEQVESLIASTANLQTQILRKFAKAALEEMRYHLWIAQEKCKMLEQECAKLRAELNKERKDE